MGGISNLHRDIKADRITEAVKSASRNHIEGGVNVCHLAALYSAPNVMSTFLRQMGGADVLDLALPLDVGIGQVRYVSPAVLFTDIKMVTLGGRSPQLQTLLPDCGLTYASFLPEPVWRAIGGAHRSQRSLMDSLIAKGWIKPYKGAYGTRAYLKWVAGVVGKDFRG